MKLTILLLSLGAYLGAALAFLTQVLLARSLSLEEFGAFSAALSFITLITPLAGFGVGAYWLKVFAEEGLQASRWIKPSVNFTLLSTMFVLAIIFLWAFFAPHNELTKYLLIILSFFVVGQAAIELASSIYQLEENYMYLAMWQFLPNAMRFLMLIVLWFFLKKEMSSMSVAVIFAMTALVMVASGVVVIRRAYFDDVSLVGHNVGRLNLENKYKPNIKDVFVQGLPFGLVGIFYLVYFQSSIISISYFLGNEYAAQYSVVITIMTGIYVLPNVIYQKFLLPKIHRWAVQDKVKLRYIYRKGNFLMFCLGVTLAVVFLFVSPYLVPAIFGEKYSDLTNILLVIACSIPIRFTATSVGSVLATNNHMMRKTKYMGFVAILNLFMTVFFITNFGLVGAAYAAVLSDVALLCFFYYSSNRFVFN